MTNFIKIFLLVFLLSFSAAAFSFPEEFARESVYAKSKEETMNILIVINGSSYAKMKNVPTVGFFEVYTILGERVKQVNLKNCKENVSIDLGKGLYILRAGKVTQKIIVR